MEFFYRRNRWHRVAFAAYEHCMTIKHFRLWDWYEFKPFFLIYFQGSEFSWSAIGWHENSRKLRPRKLYRPRKLRHLEMNKQKDWNSTEAKLNKARHPFWNEVSLNVGADSRLIPSKDARKRTRNVHPCMQFYFIEKKTKNVSWDFYD